MFSENTGIEPHSLLVENSEFGQWVRYKLDLYYAGVDEARELKTQLALIGDYFKKATSKCGSATEECRENIYQLNNLVTKASMLVTSLADHANESDHARDPLTRVLNRRYMPAILTQTNKISASINATFAILLLDIDDFKKLNDTYGHEFGDTALMELAEIMLASVRINDYVFRYGGEEFLIVLTDVTAEIAMKVSENIRSAIQNHQFQIDSSPINVTVSVGVAVSDGRQDYHKTINRADKVLYKAKHSGKNRCALAD